MKGLSHRKGDDDTEDQKIIDLYWNRSENAITETAVKYGRYCTSIAYGILKSREDAQECVSDAYLMAWNAIPPRRPADLGTYLGKITRNLSIDRLRTRNRDKRGGGEMPLALEELEEVVVGSDSPENEAIRKELAASMNRFLRELTVQERYVFLRRYWYLDSLADIAKNTGFSGSKVASMLFRLRGRLKKQLIKEELL
ncbi:MAG: sigma-70 family RNA polymerase sigma factor [Clostridiales bacterium]|nr:sigma-70 family RNA polymerase sigma factor [Clostridiales bacterium]